MKKIMFNDRYGLTQAVLDGRKTMTRRLCKEFSTGMTIFADEVDSMRVYPDENIVEFVMTNGGIKVAVPPYKVGEVVAVAQSRKDIYRELQRRYGETSDAALGFMEMYQGLPMWRNKMFVAADLCPSHIQITDIKVERLQDISDDDILKEGFGDEAVNNGCRTAAYHYETILVYYDRMGRTKEIRDREPQEAFAALIDKVSGKGTWESNPWVFAYTFKLIK